MVTLMPFLAILTAGEEVAEILRLMSWFGYCR
jgi:hypothetical protein